MSRLIVNADDFGLTSGVNRAIVELHHAGVLTSATLMARARATEEAIEMARATPTLGVGCHVVLVDGKPVLPAREIPYLADPVGERFKPTLGSFVVELCRSGLGLTGSRYFGRHLTRDIEAEAYAQMALLQERGVALDHVDTHKHTHMFPAVLRPVLRAARRAGIGRVRNPFEPAWSRRATRGASWVRRAEVAVLARMERAFRRIVAEEGFVTTDGALGVLATGSLDAGTVRALLGAMPEGMWELVAHPGYNDADLARARTRLLASRAVEQEALRAVAEFAGVGLARFGDLAVGANEV